MRLEQPEKSFETKEKPKRPSKIRSLARAIRLMVRTVFQRFPKVSPKRLPTETEIQEFPLQFSPTETRLDNPLQSKNDCSLYSLAKILRELYPDRNMNVQGVADFLQEYFQSKKIFSYGFAPETVAKALNDKVLNGYDTEAELVSLNRLTDAEKLNFLKKLRLQGHGVSIPFKNKVGSTWHNVTFEGWDDSGDVPMVHLYNPFPSEFLKGLPDANTREGQQFKANDEKSAGNISLSAQEFLLRMAQMPGKYKNSVMIIKKN